MTRYQKALRRLSARTEARVLALHRRLLDGDLTRRQFEVAAAALIVRADVDASRVAVLAVVAQLARSTRRITPLGAVTNVDARAVRGAVATVLDEDTVETATDRLGRLARNEPLVTATGAWHVAAKSGGAQGWIRRTDPDPCQLCIKWADGVVRPVTTRMARHVGCACVQQIV